MKPKGRLGRRPFGNSWCTTGGWLPAVPAPLRAAGDEADEPDDECNGGDPPQEMQGESRTKQQQSDDQKCYQHSHIPSLVIPLPAVLPDIICYRNDLPNLLCI